eukprot:scaffold102818_cov36-Phaeocystis_antarctica.AAC.2
MPKLPTGVKKAIYKKGWNSFPLQELQSAMFELTAAMGVDTPDRKALAGLVKQAEAKFDRA